MAGCRAYEHGTARLRSLRVVPGQELGTVTRDGTARRAVVPHSAVPCRAVSRRAGRPGWKTIFTATLWLRLFWGRVVTVTAQTVTVTRLLIFMHNYKTSFF
jgi:hypothetical protein